MSFLQMLSDGLAILNQYKEALLVFSLTTFGLGLLVARCLNLERFLSGLGLLACFALGCPVLVFCSYFLAILAGFWPAILIPGSFLLVLLAAVIIARHVWQHRIVFGFDLLSIAVLTGLFLILLVRLSFLRHILAPPYTDSPTHYQAIIDILGKTDGLKVKISLAHIHKYYYHFGFHTLAAWLISTSGISPLDAMSLLGQVSLVVGPISVFALALTLTGNLPGALLAGLLAAFGWSMPAFAVNWGKYPALLSLAFTPATLSAMPAHQKFSLRWSSFLLLLPLLVGTVLLHTRIVFVLGLAMTAFCLAGKLTQDDHPGQFQTILRTLAFGLFIWGFLSLFSTSYNHNLPIWIFLLVLTFFGISAYSHLMLGTLIFISGIWLQTFLPLPHGQILLDRPFIEILLAIPFSLWGGVGLAGLFQKIETRKFLSVASGLTSISLVLVVFLARGAYLPDPCCNYFTPQDAQAFAWIREHKTPQTLMIISVFADGKQRFGSDAGIWLNPLLGVGTNMLAYDTNWAAPKTLERLCQPRAPLTYVYTGGTMFGFPAENLARQSWLKQVFRADQVQVYQVTGCPQP